MKIKISLHVGLLMMILLVALALRLNRIDYQSLWLDEIYTMRMADPANSLGDIYRLSHTTDPLSVLYFSSLNLFFRIFSYNSVTARLFSVIFGLLGIWFIYLLGKELKDRTTGLIAALLLCFNYFHLYYSQEARVYTMYGAATCLSFLFLLRFLRQPGLRSAFYYGLATLWMLMSHFFGLFTLVSQVIIVVTTLFFRETKDRKTVLGYGSVALVIMVIGFLPLVPILQIISKSSVTWIEPITSKAFASLIDAFFGSSFLVTSVFILLLAYYFFNLFSQEKEAGENGWQPQSLLLLGLWVMVSFLIPYCISFIDMPSLSNR